MSLTQFLRQNSEMPNESKISRFLSQLVTMNRDHQHAAIKELSSTLIRSSLEDLKSILRFLITIDDFELELKLFALLAASITNNAAHYELLVLYDPVYDKLNATLHRGLSLKSTKILNFITALVYTDAETTSARTQLATRAKNMLRVSGCLRHLATCFMDTMMFPDTWKSLCQCVAECCRDIKLNCDHCAHLIPVCVQKCYQGLLDAITVLNSLLEQNEKNIKKFIRSNGIKIFTRDNLQSTPCLQLLCTVVQHSPEAVSCICNEEFSEQISQILEWSGPHSPNGQWCAIILYYINDDKPLNNILSSKPKPHSIEDHPISERTSNLFENTIPKHKRINNTSIIFENTKQKRKINVSHKDVNSGNDTTKLFQNIMNEIQFYQNKDGDGNKKLTESRSKTNQIRHKITPVLNSNAKNDTRKKEEHLVTERISNLFEQTMSKQKGINYKIQKDDKPMNDTTKLFQNIMNVIQYCKTKDVRGDFNRFLSENKTKTNKIRNLTPNTNDKKDSETPNISEQPFDLGNFNIKNAFVDLAEDDNDMTFSFLRHRNNCLDSKSNSMGTANEKYQSNMSSARVTMAEKSCQVDTSFKNVNNGYENDFFDEIENFDPAITSTPKHTNKATSNTRYNRTNNQIRTELLPLKIQTIKRTTTTETIKRSNFRPANHKKLIEKRNLRKAQKKSPIVKNLTKKSISSRFLEAVNESCTTIIKSVKDLFTSKPDISKKDNNSQRMSSGHSFMDYMRQRDMQSMTVLHDDMDVKDHGCITCDDTAMLREKLETDENFKRTIKKLKAGINMYGCNFKKISKILWPQERYMTPTVLYNLYRKLILK